jgi:crotonobetainyl-CoA:carnitine CoA-transferase CaiB-like acyl-CoA transferase
MTSAGIFAGVRIVELAQFVFVPGATMMLADQGAEVIHVESVGAGDPYRNLRVGDGREVGSVNLAMEQNNRGKKSIALDLKSDDGRTAMLRLIESADVFVTSLRPKAIRALRLDVHDLRARNPRLIYARGNGLGYQGEELNKPGFDASVFWARTGMCDAFTLPGADAPSPRPAFGDHSAATSLAYAIAGALYRRAVSGEPSVVETSLLQTGVWMLSQDLTYAQAPGYQVHPPGRRLPLMQAYRTKDGRKIQLMLLDPRPHWPSLCEMLGLPHLIDDPRFCDNDARMRNAQALSALLAERIGQFDWAHWQALFEDWDAPWELIRTILEVPEDPQVVANDLIFHTPSPNGGELRLVSGPATFDGRAAPLAVRRAPLMGEHTDELLEQAGYSAQAIAELKTRGAAQ